VDALRVQSAEQEERKILILALVAAKVGPFAKSLVL